MTQKKPAYDLKDCKTIIQVVDAAKGESAFLNILLPNGQWVTFDAVAISAKPVELASFHKEPTTEAKE